MDPALWNTLHDGTIVSIDGSVPGDVHLRIEIAYLCKHLPTGYNHILLHLRGCRRFDYHVHEGRTVRDLPLIASADLEVLGARLDDDTVCVACAGGSLRLAYDHVDLSLVEGSAISQAELEAAARRYWSEWGKTTRRASG